MLSAVVMAQPAKRRTTPTNTSSDKRVSTSSVQKATDRASLMFPTSDAMPEDVSWRRDVYRQLDLTLDKNAPLYYPVQPIGKQCNLFTYLFRLVLSGRVKAYEYNITTGNESFEAKDTLDVESFLRNKSIYYEEKNGRMVVGDADVPSAQVKRYYIKESTYLDQRTGTTHSKVLAICPVMFEGGEFGEDVITAKPLFWMKYDDIAPYLSKLPVMASDYNNVSNMTADDYFTLNRYEGKIYKTNNMQGRIIAEYCKTDSDMVKEQNRIEKELADFEKHLWGHTAARDSMEKAQAAEAGKSAKAAKKTKTPKSSEAEEPAITSKNRRAEKQADAEKATESPRVSARRQRR